MGAADLDRVELDLLPHIRQLRGYALRLCRNRNDAEDLVQSTLERAIVKAHQFRQNSDLRLWLFSILHNLFLSGTRRERSRRTLESVWRESVPVSAPGEQESHVGHSELMTALDRLPEAQRQVVLLVSVEGFTTDQVAALLDLPVGTVRSRLARGRDSLRRSVFGAEEQELSGGPARLRLVGGRDD